MLDARELINARKREPQGMSSTEPVRPCDKPAKREDLALFSSPVIVSLARIALPNTSMPIF